MSKPIKPISGWANGLHAVGNVGDTAVIINPESGAEGLLAWSLGQLQQLNYLLKVIGIAEHNAAPHDPSELCNAIRHQLQQIEAAVSGALDVLPESPVSQGEAA